MLYLDCAAAAPPEPETLNYCTVMLENSFANQESGHALGYRLRRELDAAAESLSRLFWGRGGGRAVWGNSCTDLFQLLAASPPVRNRRVISSVLEHPALTTALRREAKEVCLLNSRPSGRLQPPESPAEASLVALHQVQSELGVTQNLAELYAAYPGAVRFSDSAQGAGKLPLPEADIVAVSGAKLGVPGGGAALLLHPDWKGAAEFIEFAGRYRRDEHRCGRVPPSLPGALAFAAERRMRSRVVSLREVGDVNLAIRARVERLGIFPTVAYGDASPYILHLSTPGKQGAVLMRMLSERGIFVSAGSACAAESPEPSPAMLALGKSRSEAFGTLRLSFNWNPGRGTADIFLSALESVLQNY